MFGRMRWQSFARRHWFLIGIIIVIVLAHLSPELGARGGPLRPEVTVKYIAVSLIFFNSGLSIRTEDLKRALTQVRLHAYIQIFTLLFIPIVFSFLVAVLHSAPADPWLINGLLVVGCMPPPVSSAVILTKAAGGNEAAAIFNSAFGSFMGIIVTPAWLLWLLGSNSHVPFSSIFLQLASTVVLPLIVGQMFRSVYRTQIQRANLPFGTISSCILLMIIYTTFCDTFHYEEIDLDGLELIFTILLIVGIQCGLMVLSFWGATQPLFGFTPGDAITCLFCSTHKSLTLGIPILRIVYADDPELSLMSVPLLIYHPVQILLGGILVPTLKSWLHSTQHGDAYRLPSYQVTHFI